MQKALDNTLNDLFLFKYIYISIKILDMHYKVRKSYWILLLLTLRIVAPDSLKFLLVQ